MNKYVNIILITKYFLLYLLSLMLYKNIIKDIVRLIFIHDYSNLIHHIISYSVNKIKYKLY